jgi:transposase
MRKVSTGMRTAAADFIGLDLSDKTGTYVVVSVEGETTSSGKLKLSQLGLSKAFSTRPPSQIAIEVGTHSAWVSRTLMALGHTVTVANPRQVKLIADSPRKNDLLDAENLARLLRYDPRMLKPITHRGETAQADLALLRSRDAQVRARTRLINSARSTVKAAGGLLPRCEAESFHNKVRGHLPQILKPALEPMLRAIASLTEQIRASTRQLEQLADERYPQTRVLRQVKGVGTLTSLGYVLTLEAPQRFARSRSVAAFLGLTPRQHDSGESQPQLRITKAGDPFLRRLLVQSAHYILGPFGEDSDLRRWGLKLAGASKNKIRRQKAVVAVARKLAVLLHRLWLTGEVYEPLRQAALEQEAA